MVMATKKKRNKNLLGQKGERWREKERENRHGRKIEAEHRQLRNHCTREEWFAVQGLEGNCLAVVN
ncbi:hypothetical protein X777_00743 [Ooceraea biroi]|uniref:Uncharacterized protein n=1 Tax=Ooceraea biroi TaxID=2015173 RepID=A0A026WNY0_OOCBI|nr:hypothetical protein X777_00743 [Ooceraea biroi]